ncbi:PD40 domain-containing protein [Paenibacillus sp. FSL M8-0228]|jgi:dipeptidyl aminopeptidase/acylaminoacyl peptidase|uniref:PD40 domain-containing protein n=1 Tax=Paenibacillus TaxID=44249 RepID=UPI00083D8D32|nr:MULTISPECIES: PD40 domain-containing protein [Paenibacillus]MBO3284435.1 PD40 domain-containing protein [Paenibacillus polymyxa]MBP1308503.1 dipeptidyl aminopeptidase/acylaminoacyl peptidase [Paenibacillus sp. 1182]ODB59613.1 protein tolB [Paenibacillus polymyxa]
MKFVQIMSVGAIVMLVISGCSGKASSNHQLPQTEVNNTGVNSTKEGVKKVDEKATVETSRATVKKVNTLDYSQYDNNQDKSKVVVSGKQIVWKNKDVTFTAKLTNAKGEEAAEANEVVNSMKIKGKRGEQLVKLNPRPLRVNSLSLSKSNQVALHVSDHEGSRLILINLSDGTQTIVNMFEMNSDGAGSEKIDAYNWSPDGKKIAFGIGDLGSSYIGLYNVERKSYMHVSDKDFTLISSIVWHKDGKSFDFVSKGDDSPQAVLYTYSETKKSILKKGSLTKNDEQKISQLTPKS